MVDHHSGDLWVPWDSFLFLLIFSTVIFFLQMQEKVVIESVHLLGYSGTTLPKEIVSTLHKVTKQ